MNRTGYVLGAALLVGVAGLLAGCATSPESAPSAAELNASLPADAPCPTLDSMAALTNSAYGQQFQQRFMSWAFYPGEAFDARQAGTVTLCVKLSRQGHVRRAQVAQGSGFPVLDGSALFSLGMFNASGKIAPLPHDLMQEQDTVWLALPVSYQPPPKEGVADVRAKPGPCAGDGQKSPDSEQDGGTSDLHDFPPAMSRAVGSEFHYPRQALNDETSGEVLLCVSIDQDSHIIDASISHSSGSPLLDGEALIALGAAQQKNKLPKLPPSYVLPQRQKFMEFSFPVNFSIN